MALRKEDSLILTFDHDIWNSILTIYYLQATSVPGVRVINRLLYDMMCLCVFIYAFFHTGISDRQHMRTTFAKPSIAEKDMKSDKFTDRRTDKRTTGNQKSSLNLLLTPQYYSVFASIQIWHDHHKHKSILVIDCVLFSLKHS